jgi:hypothetical protein
MFARLTTLQGSPDRVDQAIQLTEQRIIPMAKGQPGFKGGYWAVDRSTGRGIAFTLWESQQAEQDSDAAFAQGARDEVAREVAGQIVSIDRYEVFAQA